MNVGGLLVLAGGAIVAAAGLLGWTTDGDAGLLPSTFTTHLVAVAAGVGFMVIGALLAARDRGIPLALVLIAGAALAAWGAWAGIPGASIGGLLVAGGSVLVGVFDPGTPWR